MENFLKNDWQKILKSEIYSENFLKIKKFLEDEEKRGKIIFPPKNLIFNAFNLTKFSDLKVVILGQDPYHGKGQAHGLCFSVQDGVKNPPSLKNIFKELKNDLGIEISENGNLEKWASQGVFLLNAILTVESGKPASHSKIGWENFTDSVIKKISDEKKGVVFLLWGNFAKSKKKFIDKKKHFILESAHPSPFSVKNFYGGNHFSKTNEILEKIGKTKIDWSLI
ncbi:uracil-DNA glycosylase [Candidatus Gracilibacteria bacterium]|nr:uracil-DNA glycosylase [Candidatus Gracilibacteria bacterium]